MLYYETSINIFKTTKLHRKLSEIRIWHHRDHTIIANNRALYTSIFFQLKHMMVCHQKIDCITHEVLSPFISTTRGFNITEY